MRALGTVPAFGMLRPELALMAMQARAGRVARMLQVGELTIRCMTGVERDADGVHIKGLKPVFDAIDFAPDYSWRCGRFDTIKFTGDLVAMDRWLASRIPAG